MFGNGCNFRAEHQLANGAPATGRFDDDDFDDMISADVVARWDYDDSFDFDDSVDYDNSVDYDDSPDTPAPTKAPVVQDSPDDSPDYEDS